jgi:peptidoglycan/xylan/chitin deacetylase (PgdA/CDA1 family)
MNVRLGRAFGKSGLAPALLMTRRRLNVAPWITVLSYHRAAHSRSPTEYDDEVVDVTTDDLEEQLQFLERHCNVISLDQLRAFTSGARLPANPVLLTFDDGYRDNHDVVLPMLQRHRMTAVFFVTTAHVEQRRLFWWDRVNLLLKTSRQERIELKYPCHVALSLASFDERGTAIQRVLRTIKDHYALDLERFLHHVAAAADVSISRTEETERVAELLMTWDHVRALRRAGMDVQSHTSTHRVLQTLPPAALAAELRDSRAMLEAVLGEPVNAISYPVGRSIDSLPHVREALRSAGYALGFSNCSGPNRSSHFDALDVRRISADSARSISDFQSLIAFPSLGW